MLSENAAEINNAGIFAPEILAGIFLFQFNGG